eukprot:Phypoly_transcript_14277.p1 GENE.Phypoly_transcript_14277~~Phypoly_transcript_14277.p1  ORF type:complete len:158 (+),score=12.16 Phypoly_transcript_14277:509-982(+)
MIADSYRKQVEIDGKNRVLDITATVGVEDWSALRDQYISTGDGFIIAYSITSTSSFEAASKLRNSIFRYRNESRDIPLILVGTMCDLENERAVTTTEAKLLAEKWRCGFMEASAKTDTNVNEIFEDLVGRIDKNRDALKLSEDYKKPKTKKRAWTLL